MPSSSQKTVVRFRTPPAPLRIRNWLLYDEPLRSGSLLGTALLTAVASGLVSGQPLTAMLIFVVLNLTLLRVWFPVDYEFSLKGIVRSFLWRKTRTAWSDIAGYELHTDGVLLCADPPSPFPVPARCHFIRWNGQREELAALLEFYLARRPEG